VPSGRCRYPRVGSQAANGRANSGQEPLLRGGARVRPPGRKGKFRSPAPHDHRAELFEAIADTFERGSNVIIPTFALERAHELLYFLREGISGGRLAAATPVFLDSPMAISATEIFRRHPEGFGPATATLFQGGQDPFDLPGLHFTRQTA
jgi:Cft2 family RNA processing exonuclease